MLDHLYQNSEPSPQHHINTFLQKQGHYHSNILFWTIYLLYFIVKSYNIIIFQHYSLFCTFQALLLIWMTFTWTLSSPFTYVLTKASKHISSYCPKPVSHIWNTTDTLKRPLISHILWPQKWSPVHRLHSKFWHGWKLATDPNQTKKKKRKKKRKKTFVQQSSTLSSGRSL